MALARPFRPSYFTLRTSFNSPFRPKLRACIAMASDIPRVLREAASERSTFYIARNVQSRILAPPDRF
jgi:hypothetical protein